MDTDLPHCAVCKFPCVQCVCPATDTISDELRSVRNRSLDNADLVELRQEIRHLDKLLESESARANAYCHALEIISSGQVGLTKVIQSLADLTALNQWHKKYASCYKCYARPATPETFFDDGTGYAQAPPPILEAAERVWGPHTCLPHRS
jgi:hypothetical protein